MIVNHKSGNSPRDHSLTPLQPHQTTLILPRVRPTNRIAPPSGSANLPKVHPWDCNLSRSSRQQYASTAISGRPNRRRSNFKSGTDAKRTVDRFGSIAYPFLIRWLTCPKSKVWLRLWLRSRRSQGRQMAPPRQERRVGGDFDLRPGVICRAESSKRRQLNADILTSRGLAQMAGSHSADESINISIRYTDLWLFVRRFPGESLYAGVPPPPPPTFSSRRAVRGRGSAPARRSSRTFDPIGREHEPSAISAAASLAPPALGLAAGAG